MKKFFLFFFVVASLHSAGQNMSGFYSGTLYNDTTKQTQLYELALSDYRGKITGWAYATFIANDTFYYSIRRVKGSLKGGHLIVEDGAMIANNFPSGPDKGVRRITQIPVNHLADGDTLRNFNATWRTTATKQFYSLPGVMAMQRRTDSSQSALFAHLAELGQLQAPKATPAVAQKTENAKAGQKEKEAFTNTTTKNTTDKTTTTTDKKVATPAVAAAPIPYTQRSQKVLETFEVAGDSLELHFYDNGVVDGDIISVYINNEPVVSQSKLLAVATKRTVPLAHFAGDEITLVLVAETLGDMPPNTGLLVVHDGKHRYEVRFSADLQTNAALVIRKRKN